MKLITPPVVEPVSVDEFKLYRRMTYGNAETAEDSLIAQLIKAAREWCEARQSRAYITQTWQIVLERFPCGREIKLPLPPLQSICHIKYYGTDGIQQTLNPDQYGVDTYSEPGRIVLNPNCWWPPTVCGRFDTVEIRFTAGYGDSGDKLPEYTRQAIQSHAGYYYENREADTFPEEFRFAMDALLATSNWGNYV